ncbi:hypothetical protein J7I94_14235 [Streptomyces sp. ISL-12]|uniref:hypothetical protein n=1 Tax=Streptomyces sp. ISL-12 TaxID=2819177 RepID=UPI001BE61EC1|nr:hypothetical protein [Streptomyces sp. ISL-12]MBT2411711.1 hypothetical protein [Streptomyces sp. ISL-12]
MADDPRAVAEVQRRAGNRATVRTVRLRVDRHNVLDLTAAAAYDAAAGSVTPRGRGAALRNIVWAEHWAPISEVCRKHKYTIAVRETGEHSIRRIAEGAKAKPHDILEKSIKPSSVRRAYGTGTGQAESDPVAVLSWLTTHDLDGFVGHWNERGLIGVRIDHPPQSVLDAGIVRTGAKGEQYVPIDMKAPGGGPHLRRLKADPNWKQYLYTGDYDLHEAYAATGGTTGGQIAEATPEKAKLLSRLNDGIAGGAREQVVRGGTAAVGRRGLHMASGSDYAMFQHGDQATYRMNQYLEARALEEPVGRQAAQLVRAVATESDEPLAWCRMGQWYVTTNRKEHAVLRDRWKLAVPHTWGDAERERTARGGYRTARYTD